MIKNVKEFIKNVADQITDYFNNQYDLDSKRYQTKEIQVLLHHEYEQDLNCIYSSLSMIQSLMEDRQ